jgi:hypothetical protein
VSDPAPQKPRKPGKPRPADTYRSNGAPVRVLPSHYAGMVHGGKVYPTNGRREIARRLRQASK